jgi:hypothetical protein
MDFRNHVKIVCKSSKENLKQCEFQGGVGMFYADTRIKFSIISNIPLSI